MVIENRVMSYAAVPHDLLTAIAPENYSPASSKALGSIRAWRTAFAVPRRASSLRISMEFTANVSGADKTPWLRN